MLKRYALAIVVIYILLLTIASLVNNVNIPNLGSSFDDKIYHTVAYVLLTLLFYNFLLTKNVKNKIMWSATVAIVYGGLIEILQSLFTDSRISDVKDVLANSFGVIFAVLIIALHRKLKLK